VGVKINQIEKNITESFRRAKSDIIKLQNQVIGLSKKQEQLVEMIMDIKGEETELAQKDYNIYKKKKVLVVGAGITGLTVARLLTNKGYDVTVYEKEKEIGGLCKDYRDESGIIVNNFGTHAFHTNSKIVWDFVNKYSKFNNFKYKAFCITDSGLITWPINKEYEKLNNFLGNDNNKIINDYILEYSKKQWKGHFKEIKDKIDDRIEIKTIFKNYFFTDKYQGMPINGFSKLFEHMIIGNEEEDKITMVSKVFVNFEIINNIYDKFDYFIITSPIDEFFNYNFKELEYITLDFDFLKIKCDYNLLPSPTVNLPRHKEITRMTEYKKFYDTKSDDTIISIEKPRKAIKNDIKMYPILNYDNIELYDKYRKYTHKYKKIKFLGRLGRYKYLNMDQSILLAMNFVEELK